MSIRWSAPLAALASMTIGFSWWRAARLGQAARVPQSLHRPETSAWPSVSVLVPAWREAGTIEECLAALAQVDYPDWQVIVIAGGPDGTLEIARQAQGLPGLTVIPQGQGGKNAALTLGLAYATGAVIVVLDADSLVEPSWLHKIVQPLRAGAAAACGMFLPRRRSWVSEVEQMETLAAYHIQRDGALQGSGSIAIWCDALEQAGGFPASVTTGVDWDLDVRLARLGLPRAYAVDAHVRTHRPATVRSFWKNNVRWRRAHLRLLLRHRSQLLDSPVAALQGLSIYIQGFGLAGLLLLACLCLLTGRWQSARIFLTAAFGGLGWTMARRAGLAVTIVGYTGEWRWLRVAWAPALLLAVDFSAALWAALTLARQTVHFKGPRP